ncbi:selenium-dependent molybdenum cofactor biosynthesis protein YqeB [Fusibacter ferrireducens]|uniref:EF2563 family selenium-dependent molybdenum hydroxylase system protein n=1 Tax=Fusibacter ferrireducens TaxID=2785058 RepID=A0ABR9ZTS0_9FIRM|nr:selenium-dependent molybdenum cofactor biosynthesis protein YqeB [Fusibacter ferrireducens]MBF4693543.1 EF2563 family selenium-dependent molybdenum hydroxylase system protein [Fusibacter ferrireducens]
MTTKVLIRGGGDLASAVIQKLYRSGYKVVVSELETPRMIRRTVSFSNAIYESSYVVEGIEAVWINSVDEIEITQEQGKIPVLTLPESEIYDFFKPDVFVDATLSKKKVHYKKSYAKVVIGLGPNIRAGVDAHTVIETSRGHDLGRLIFSGFAKENTHVPGDIGGYTHERVLRAPCAGHMRCEKKIGDFVRVGEVVMTVGGVPVMAKLDGVIRGLIHESVKITEGLKIGDIDPRGNVQHCFTISDKGRNLAGGVLEAILIGLNSR